MPTGHNDLWASENVKVRNSEFPPWNFLWLWINIVKITIILIKIQPGCDLKAQMQPFRTKWKPDGKIGVQIAIYLPIAKVLCGEGSPVEPHHLIIYFASVEIQQIERDWAIASEVCCSMEGSRHMKNCPQVTQPKLSGIPTLTWHEVGVFPVTVL